MFRKEHNPRSQVRHGLQAWSRYNGNYHCLRAPPGARFIGKYWCVPGCWATRASSTVTPPPKGKGSKHVGALRCRRKRSEVSGRRILPVAACAIPRRRQSSFSSRCRPCCWRRSRMTRISLVCRRRWLSGCFGLRRRAPPSRFLVLSFSSSSSRLAGLLTSEEASECQQPHYRIRCSEGMPHSEKAGEIAADDDDDDEKTRGKRTCYFIGLKCGYRNRSTWLRMVATPPPRHCESSPMTMDGHLPKDRAKQSTRVVGSGTLLVTGRVK